ncbi:hypothetical protein L7F22_048131 [Adiantum nelumboides]|nr:hypothetical protein [Adiantum nelumboides]
MYQLLALLVVVVSVYVKQKHATNEESMEVDYEELVFTVNLYCSRQSHHSFARGQRNLLLQGMINERLAGVAHRWVLEQQEEAQREAMQENHEDRGVQVDNLEKEHQLSTEDLEDIEQYDGIFNEAAKNRPIDP